MKPSRRLPIATVLLILANMVAAFAVVLSPDLADNFGFLPLKPSFQTAISSLFLHQNVLHLLGNMVFLAAVGPAVEIALGSVRFSAVYVLGGLAGVATHYVFAAKDPLGMPLIGASACIAACAAYYSVRYSRLRVPLAPNLAIPVVAVAAVWVFLQAIGGFVTFGDNMGGTAYWAHLGGFVAGLLMAGLFRAPQMAGLQLGHEVLERMNERSVGAALAATEAHLKLHPTDVKALEERAEALAKIGDKDEEAEVLLRLAELTPDSKPDILFRLWEIGKLEQLPSLKRTMLAEQVRAERPEVARALLMSVVQGPEADGQRPEALLALANLDFDAPEKAAPWVNELFTRYPMHPACELARAKGWKPTP